MSWLSVQISGIVQLADANKPARTCGSRPNGKIRTTKKTNFERNRIGAPIILTIGKITEQSTWSTPEKIEKIRSHAMPSVTKKRDCKERT